jgi:hypothetical protein
MRLNWRGCQCRSERVAGYDGEFESGLHAEPFTGPSPAHVYPTLPCRHWHFAGIMMVLCRRSQALMAEAKTTKM